MSQHPPDVPGPPGSAWPPTHGPTPEAGGPAPPLAAPAAAVLVEIRRLGLLGADQMAEADRLAAGGAEALLRELAGRGWLTPLQANRLLQGQALAVGGCLLLRRLGAGGMGMVFEARQVRLGRQVAIKVIHQNHLASEEAVRRFRREVEATSRLEHPNVVRALDAGHDGHVHYLVLELVEGADLARLINERGPLAVHDACECVRQAALGLAHAHERGLVHRDVKPSNMILATDQGGRSLVKLLDLGLSRGDGAEGDATSLTDTGAVMGTPDFMAPEQVRDSKRADARSDLYALGCTLYFLLAGRPPFAGGTIGLKLVQHQMEEPEPVESLRRQVPAAVAAVVRRLMAKRPEDRYQSAAEAAEVLAGILKAANWSPAGAFSALRGDATEVVSPPSLAPRRPFSPRRLAVALAIAVPAVALASWLVWLLTRPAPVPPSPPPPPPPDYALDRLQSKNVPATDRFAWQPRELVQVLGEHRGRHWSYASGLVFSADGQTLYTVASVQLVAWDVETLRPLADLGVSGNPRSLGLIREGKGLFLSDGYVGLSLHVAPSLRQTEAFPRSHPRAVSPDGRFGLTGFVGDPVRLLGLADGSESKPLAAGCGPNLPFVGVAFSPDGKRFAHATKEGPILLREVADLDRVVRLEGHPGKVATVLRFSADGQRLAVGTESGDVSVWHLDTGKMERGWPLGQPFVVDVHFAGTDRLVALRYSVVTVHSRASGVVRTIADPRYKRWGIARIAVSPDGKVLAMGNNEGLIQLWDVESGKETSPPRDNQSRVYSMLLSPDGSRLVTTGNGLEGGRAVVWDVEAGRSVAILTDDSILARAAVLTPDGKAFYLGNEKGTLSLCDLADGKTKRTWAAALNAPIRALAVLPDGRLVMGGDAGRLVIFDPDAGKVVSRLDGIDGTVESLTSYGTGDGFRLVATGTRKQTAGTLLNLYSADGRLLRTVTGLREGGQRAFVSPDGRLLAATDGWSVRLWDVDRLDDPSRVVAETSRDATAVAVAFFPDGERVAVAYSNGVVQLRTLRGEELRRWKMPGAVNALAVDATGRYLVTGNGNGTAYVLRLAGPR